MNFLNISSARSFSDLNLIISFFSIKKNAKKKEKHLPRNLVPLSENTSIGNSFFVSKKARFKQERGSEKLISTTLHQFQSKNTEESLSFKKERKRLEQQFRNRNLFVRNILLFSPEKNFFFFTLLLELFFLIGFFSRFLKNLEKIKNSFQFLVFSFVETAYSSRAESSGMMDKEKGNKRLKVGAHPVFFYENQFKNRHKISKRYK
mmetsp:Transcript_28460/g.67460  ORF Transcript_28460/g.67460 Transcript_28460/m.67460 type:complete len:205 (-) Transcript_28460:283-897(-)